MLCTIRKRGLELEDPASLAKRPRVFKLPQSLYELWPQALLSSQSEEAKNCKYDDDGSN